MPLILHYREALGRRGKLFGELILADGKTLAVWDAGLHEQVQQYAKQRVVPVVVKSRVSARGNAYLTHIEQETSYEAAYDQARGTEEAGMIGRSVPGKYVRDQISKRVQRHVERHQKGAA